ncbi:hypothetical protein [Spirillospora sp. NBC_01491]|uniref:hypothetical protein n=1 Tax=Spirillospora sp. NBC_01491 TaxID=2976007 RepID=UPI002E361E1C|nr:hypothetical protein [Spirillospora sp. NBC_01491]
MPSEPEGPLDVSPGSPDLRGVRYTTGFVACAAVAGIAVAVAAFIPARRPGRGAVGNGQDVGTAVEARP